MEPNKATVLSAGIQGFSEFSLSCSSGELNALLKEYFDLTEATIRLHQGKLSNFSGDSILAVFSQKKNENFSELLAIEASTEISEKLASFFNNNKSGIKIGFKAGIASGDAIVGEIGTAEKTQITAMGEAVNKAIRLRDFAENQQVLVCGNVFSKTKDQYSFQKQEPLRVRGSKDLLEVYELKEKKRPKIQPASFSERKIASEMVGRSRELEQLEGLIKQLIAGKGSIVNIVGKAGIGKSRLMAEMKVQPIMEKVLLLEGRASSTGQNLSFHPITNLIRSWAGITEDDVPSASSEKLFQGIKLNTPEQADEIYAFIATMMGLPIEGKHKERVKGIEGEALEKLILKNLRDLIISATKDKPRIYLIEDMHWADSSSITMFESLYKLSQNHPVMFINVLRPGYKETGDYILKWLVDNLPGDNITITISPLEEKESGELINNLLKKVSLPEKVASTIIRKTEGNPFFIEEVIRSFLDEGIIEIHEKDFIVTERINEVNIPETINDVILSRVDKLDEKTRELLNTASVMGRNFYYKVLEEATDTIGELDDRLAYLTDVQLISESKKKQEIEYLFKHALAQQLTYDAMMQQSRKDTHLKIARSIEKVFAANINEFYGTLVYHYEKAENKEKTQEYLMKAGDEAVRTGATHEALRFYEKALEMILRDNNQNLSKEEIMELEMRIADLYRECGKNLEATERFKKLIETYTKHRFSKSEKLSLLRSACSLFLIYVMVHNKRFFFKKKINREMEMLMKMSYSFGSALLSMNPKQFAIDSLPIVKKICCYNFRNSVPSLRIFTSGSINFGMTGLSLKTSQKMLEISEESGIENDVVGFASFLMIDKMQNYYTGRWHTKEDRLRTINKEIRAGSFWDTTGYNCYSGLAYIETGEYVNFIVMHNMLQEQAENYNSSYAVSLAYRLKANGFYKFRKLDDFIKIEEEGEKQISNTDNLAHLVVFHSIQSLVHLRLGNFNKAEKAISKAKELQEKVSNIPIFHTHYLLAIVHFDLEKILKLKEKEPQYKAMVKEINRNSKKLIAKSKKMIANLTEAYLLRSRIFMFQQKFKKAFKNLQLAIQTGEKYNSRLELSRAYFETGKFLSNPKTKQKQLNSLLGNEYLEKAKTMFEEMDLQWDLGEYRNFINSL